MNDFKTQPDGEGCFVHVLPAMSFVPHDRYLIDVYDGSEDRVYGALVTDEDRVALAKFLLTNSGYVVVKSEDAADAAFTLRSIEHKGAAIYTDLADKIEGI